MQNKNVLIFPCGTEIAQEIHAALKHEKSVTLSGASSVEDHGRMVFARYIPDIPFIGDRDFNSEFNACLKEHKIDFVIPAHDSALLYLAENRETFLATIIAPVAAICRLCRSKKATYDALASEDFVPAYYETPQDVPEFPVFLKPDVGQGSQGVMLAKDMAHLEEAVRINPGLLICEYLPGNEFTIDCYSNKAGELLFSGARERCRTKAGISVHSKTLPRGGTVDARIQEIGRQISSKLGITGTWFFQVKEAADKTLKLLEVAPRVAGTMALHRVMGVNFPLLALFEAEGQPVASLYERFDGEIERALINRYTLSLNYNCLYLDLDDTLVVHNRLNMTLMRLVYQCIEKNIPVKLITRHYRDPKITLEELKLHEGLFDEIIWITDKTTPKSNFMKAKDGLFIDDSYRERLDVSEKLRMPVLAPDGAEALLDWHS